MSQFIPIPPASFEPVTRTGGCMCGACRFEYHGVPLEVVHVLSCDCNFCAVFGTINFYTKPETIKFVGGTWQTILKHRTAFHKYYENNLTYSFCATCGSFFGAETPHYTMINARLFDDIDVSELPTRKFHARGRTARMDAEEAEAKAAKVAVAASITTA